MNLANDFTIYKEEIDLILAQNTVEIELYSIIACIIRERENSNNISLRDVTTRRGTKFSKIFKSQAGFPDFIILTKKFNKYAPDVKQILGAIEAKRVSSEPLVYSDQLREHIKYFKNVIYTNGLEWKFYKSDGLVEKKSAEWAVTLGKINGEEICWGNNGEWKNLLQKIEEIDWIRSEK